MSTDVLKGSYYANPTVESSTVPEVEKAAYPEYYGQNICTFLTSTYERL